SMRPFPCAALSSCRLRSSRQSSRYAIWPVALRSWRWRSWRRRFLAPPNGRYRQERRRPRPRARWSERASFLLAFPLPFSGGFLTILGRRLHETYRSPPEIGAALFHRVDDALPIHQAVGLGVAHRLHALGGGVDDGRFDHHRLGVHLPRQQFQFAGPLQHVE